MTTGRTQLLSSVTNAARVLKEFGRGDTQLGISQLARRIDVGKSTAHRLVSTLVAEGLLEKVEDTGLFRLTNTMRAIGLSAETAQSLHQAATAPLDQLRKHTDATLHVSILDGADVIYVERRESPSAMQVFRRVGSRAPVHCTATGKCLLAYLPKDDQDTVLNTIRLIRKTPYSITNRAALQKELQQIKRQGFAENRYESEMGMCSIAAPIRDRNGRVVAAISIAATTPDRTTTLAPLARPLIETAVRISHALGWRG